MIGLPEYLSLFHFPSASIIFNIMWSVQMTSIFIILIPFVVLDFQ